MNKPKFLRNEQLLTIVCAVFLAAFLFLAIGVAVFIVLRGLVFGSGSFN